MFFPVNVKFTILENHVINKVVIGKCPKMNAVYVLKLLWCKCSLLLLMIIISICLFVLECQEVSRKKKTLMNECNAVNAKKILQTLFTKIRKMISTITDQKKNKKK